MLELQEGCSFGRGLVNHFTTNRIFPDSPDRLPLDLISSVAPDAHLQRKKCQIYISGHQVAPKQLRSST